MSESTDASSSSPPTLSKSLSRVLKISARKGPKEGAAVVAGSPDKSSAPEGGKSPRSKLPALAKKNSQAALASTAAPPPRGGKGIESIQKLVSKNKRRFVGKGGGEEKREKFFFSFFFYFFFFFFFFRQGAWL